MWKFIVLRVGNTDYPFFFPATMVHSMVADALKGYFLCEVQFRMKPHRMSVNEMKRLTDEMKVVSAGEIGIDFGNPTGRSETVGVGPREGDRELFTNYPYLGGAVVDEEELL